MSNNQICGVVTPLLTPYNDDLSISEDLYLQHAADILTQGSHFLSPFGTTGEALSNSTRERMGILELLASSGVASAGQLMPGTGLCSLEETIALTRHAYDLGCAAAMLLPPFFYSNPDDEGLYRYFSQLIEAMGDKAPKIILYHIPQNTGVAISPPLSARLNTAFPEIVVAYKDSSGDWENTVAVINAAPGLAVFPASETVLKKGMDLGAAGCISATCNSNVGNIRAMYDAVLAGDAAQVANLQPGLEQHRKAVQNVGLIGGLKSLKAAHSNDPRWLNLRAPHVNADPGFGVNLFGGQAGERDGAKGLGGHSRR
ncbi:MAG: dihydrodipicolinate synthase family protein [Rhodobacteraceae bacterium]|nr:dihydrodipicolinate synthase family protein [Paracoccaceae bacterium]